MNTLAIFTLCFAADYTSLVSDLSSDLYDVRTDAYIELEMAGEDAIPILQTTFLTSKDRHTRFACKELLVRFSEHIKATNLYDTIDFSVLTYGDGGEIQGEMLYFKTLYGGRNLAFTSSNTLSKDIALPLLLEGKSLKEINIAMNEKVTEIRRSIFMDCVKECGFKIKGKENAVSTE